jgi:hypothetical protein
MEKTEIRDRLADLPEGAKVRVKLEDGTEVAGSFGGVEGDQVHIDGADDVAVERVENVLMDVSTAGPE